MSKETLEWLNTNTLIGFTSKRGNAWHYRAADQGAEPNHYAGNVPVDDVRRRLFSWSAIPGEISATALTADGVVTSGPVPDRTAIMRSDTGAVLGIHSGSYAIHQYSEWLLDTVATMLDDNLSVGSAGLLRGGAVAWVSVEVPDTITTPEGVTFRPNLLACTSMDGSLATTFKRVVTNTVCDNTMSAALRESGETFRVKHTRNSGGRIGEARQALNLIHATAEAFEVQVRELCSVRVSDAVFNAWLDATMAVPVEKGRGQTMAQNKQDAFRLLWNKDARVTPWRNTAWGVVQAANTFAHHVQSVRGVDAPERNTLRALSGGVDTLDAGTLSSLRKVLATV